MGLFEYLIVAILVLGYQVSRVLRFYDTVS